MVDKSRRTVDKGRRPFVLPRLPDVVRHQTVLQLPVRPPREDHRTTAEPSPRSASVYRIVRDYAVRDHPLPGQHDRRPHAELGPRVGTDDAPAYDAVRHHASRYVQVPPVPVVDLSVLQRNPLDRGPVMFDRQDPPIRGIRRRNRRIAQDDRAGILRVATKTHRLVEYDFHRLFVDAV